MHQSKKKRSSSAGDELFVYLSPDASLLDENLLPPWHCDHQTVGQGDEESEDEYGVHGRHCLSRLRSAFHDAPRVGTVGGDEAYAPTRRVWPGGEAVRVPRCGGAPVRRSGRER
ncbi:hypothetical protein GUJ93_ZPchr0002g25395 [Zizania palustris]|uniref:Uncharacterized protein n=1 Tax=Zizania palustris TaxID=103762 RepID=A0A8J5RE49_ZIZPA|nr:hypothetical protein GUJ93_ZPchr0002g25395 [Zizania palustris]